MNRATRINTAAIGVLFGFSGITHGIGELLQGNRPTGGMFINAIAAGSRWTRWVEGSEGAVTLVPNFLLTGTLAVLLGLAIIYWSLCRLHKPWGPGVYLLLFVLLFLVGGGIGQVIFFIPAWWVATRIRRPLTWWRKVLPPGFQTMLGALWPTLLIIPSRDHDGGTVSRRLWLCAWFCEHGPPARYHVGNGGVSWLLFLLAFATAFAYDIVIRPNMTLHKPVLF
ncbi:MAG: hypothetical protein R2932_32740 [Caldilineaceae bacterium]